MGFVTGQSGRRVAVDAAHVIDPEAGIGGPAVTALRRRPVGAPPGALAQTAPSPCSFV